MSLPEPLQGSADALDAATDEYLNERELSQRCLGDDRTMQDVEDIDTGDYPDAAVENARMALEAREDTGNPNDCGTRVGWERANQLVNGEDLSEETIGRMAAFERHEDNKGQGEDGREDCGWMMWNAWGGDEGIAWAQRKQEAFEEARQNSALSGDTDFRDAAEGRTLSVPDNAVSISDRSEAPEGATIIEGDRGGLYYIPAGGDDSDQTGDSEARQRVQDIAESDASEDEKKAELESVVSDTTGVESVNFDNFDEQQATATSDALVALGEAGETDGIQEISTDVTEEMSNSNAMANYDPFDQTIRFDPDSFTEEKAQEWGGNGFLAGDSIRHLVAHEVGHHRHFQNQIDGQSAGMQAQAQEIPEGARAAFAEDVSVYAVENPNEMVAELYAMQVQGEELTTGMENAYEEFGGPEVDV